MNINQARLLITEIADLLYSDSGLDMLRARAIHYMWAEEVDNRFVKAILKLHTLGRLDAGLNGFIEILVEAQLRNFHHQLHQTQRYHAVNGRVYSCVDVLNFASASQVLLQHLSKKVEQIHFESRYQSDSFAVPAIAC
jgi:hypothetical protein